MSKSKQQSALEHYVAVYNQLRNRSDAVDDEIYERIRVTIGALCFTHNHTHQSVRQLSVEYIGPNHGAVISA